MERTDTLPEWMDIDFTNGHPGYYPNMPARLMTSPDGQDYLFSGMLSYFLKSLKIPEKIHIAFDMTQNKCMLRADFSSNKKLVNKDKHQHIYTECDFEAFALLWNDNPEKVHGLPSSMITLSLKTNEDDFFIVLVPPIGMSRVEFFDGKFQIQYLPAEKLAQILLIDEDEESANEFIEEIEKFIQEASA